MVETRPDSLPIIPEFHRAKKNFGNPPTRGQFHYSNHISIASKLLISLSAGKLRAPSLVMLIKRLIKAGAQDFLTMPGGGYIHVTSAFPLTHHYQAVLAWGP